LICEREKEIKDFNPEEFWKLTAYLKASNPPEFQAGLVKIGGRKKKIRTGKEAENIVTELKKLPFELKDVKIKEKKKNPQAPYITSTLQQDSFHINRFSVKKTMMVAQKLYEGINIGDKGLVGLITYMRTDSFRVSNDAIKSCRKFIKDGYSAEYLPEKPRIYKNKKKAQDAHEAIRPTSFDLPPEKVKAFLNKDQLRLYTMIWNRFIASQMNPALIEETVFDIQAGKYLFQVKGEVLKFDGFMAAYPRKNKEGKILPKAQPGEELKLLKLEPEQKFTQPPPRYTEGSLVKELEARGIGRPSTYVPIISTLLNRDYVIKEKGKFIPLELGIFVTDYLIKNFPELMKFEFTVQLEETLDKISEGEEWVGYLESYNSLLEKNLSDAEKTESVKAKGIPSEDKCPECGKKLVIKSGKYGRFKACSGYPDCTFKQSIGKKEAKPVDEKCPKCGSQMVLRRGKYGPFVACSNYPSCKYIKKEKKDTGISCPECDGMIVQKKTRKGKLFFGCSNFPKCKFASWDEPVKKPCPECNRGFVLRKNTMKQDAYLYCSDKNCGYKETVKAKQIWEKNME
jgi:DNA topoisomerase-1